MSLPIPQPYLAHSAAASLLGDGSTRIYYQGPEGAIREISGVGSVISPTIEYDDIVIVPAASVRANTPIAVTSWLRKPTNTDFCEVRHQSWFVTGDICSHSIIDSPLLY